MFRVLALSCLPPPEYFCQYFPAVFILGKSVTRQKISFLGKIIIIKIQQKFQRINFWLQAFQKFLLLVLKCFNHARFNHNHTVSITLKIIHGQMCMKWKNFAKKNVVKLWLMSLNIQTSTKFTSYLYTWWWSTKTFTNRSR